MSIQTEISRIQFARNTLRTKAVELKISSGTEKLDELAEDYNGIQNQGGVTAQVKEGQTYTIPKGYHSGTGTVKVVLEEKQVTPTKAEQPITPSPGKVLSKVTVAAIPDEYVDTTGATAEAGEILLGETAFVNGQEVTGTMPSNGSVSKVLDAGTTSFGIASGYHDGTGSVSIVPETKSATPTKEAQNITPTSGKVLTKVIVAAIPAEYVTTGDATAK